MLYIVLLRLWQWAFCLDKSVSRESKRIPKTPPSRFPPGEWNATLNDCFANLLQTLWRLPFLRKALLSVAVYIILRLISKKWLYCWCRFLSYRLIVFNKESIGTNYMVLRLVIDKALRLMMWEKLGLCLCAWKVSDGGLWYLKCGCVRFPPCSLNGSDFLNPSTMMDSWKWKRAVLI